MWILLFIRPAAVFGHTHFKYRISSPSQSDLWVDSPEQSSPPFEGAGLEHERLLVLFVPEHDDQEDQQAQLP